MKAPIFLIIPMKFYVQQMLLVKCISENIAKVTTTNTIYEFSLRFRLYILQATSVARKISQA